MKRVACMLICISLIVSMCSSCLAELNPGMSEAGVNEQTQTNKLTIDEIYLHIKEYCNHVHSHFLLKSYVREFLMLNYSYCSAELIAELIKQKHVEIVYWGTANVLYIIWRQMPRNVLIDAEYSNTDLSGFFINPDDYAFFSNTIEDLVAFYMRMNHDYTIDKEALKRFVRTFEEAYQETAIDNINRWFILGYIGSSAQGILDMLFEEGLIASSGSKKVEGYKRKKLDEYIDYDASSYDHLVLRKDVVLDYNSKNEYIAYLGALNCINQIVDEFYTKILTPYGNKLEDEMRHIKTNKNKSSSDEYIFSGKILYGVSLGQVSADGFLIPVPEDARWDVNISNYQGGNVYRARGESVNTDTNPIVVRAYCHESKFAENPDVARTEIEKALKEIADSHEKVEQKIINLDGHPVGLIKYTDTDSDVGYIIYIRNNRRLTITVGSDIYWVVLGGGRTFNPISISDLKELASKLSYDESLAPFTAAKATFTICTKDGVNVVSAGKNLQMSAVFDNPELINKKAKNDGVTWSVFNAETGDTLSAAMINANGQLRIDKNLDMPVQLLVKATSTVFGTEASYMITAMPVVSKIILDPTELFFYIGTEDPQTVKATLEPATVPPVGLTWTAVKNGIVEITPVEDGMVSIKPLKAGKTDIAVKEPGGKNARLTVNVVAPVESVELKANGAATAGGKVKIAATLAPKNAGNKAVQWSLDVGEEIATINEKGQLTIGKEVASGTKITVTCTALGAPGPVSGTVVIEIP